jgi:hypothetical protein
MPTEREINPLYELSQADFQLYMTDRARSGARLVGRSDAGRVDGPAARAAV